MTTIADELLNDFEDSGSENEEEQTEELFTQNTTAEAEITDGTSNFDYGGGGGMILDGDEEEPDEEGIDSAPSHLKIEDGEDEEETKARVEKMELKTVSDVRSVAGLMKQLDPVTQVGLPTFPSTLQNERVYISNKQPA